MQFTFISWGLLATVVGAGLAAFIYFRLVRENVRQSHPEFEQTFQRHDRWIAGAWAWMKVRWDVTAGVVLAALPTLWNAVLDLSVLLAGVLAEVLPAVSGLDLSTIVMPDGLRSIISIAGAVGPPLLRAVMQRREA